MDYIHGCLQIAKAPNIPSTAVLTRYLVLTSYVISPSTVKIPDTDCAEPVLLWLTVAMPTGSGKSTLFRYLSKLGALLVWAVKIQLGFLTMQALKKWVPWCILMCQGYLAYMMSYLPFCRRSICIEDEASDSHELALFLLLYNGHPWRRDTGRTICFTLSIVL